ncbi:MAG: hypothetical protein ACXAC5_02250 [Promethearchaeota archaeon]
MDQPKVTDFTEIEELGTRGADCFVLRVLLDSGRKVGVGRFSTRQDAEQVELAISQVMIEYRTKRNTWERVFMIHNEVHQKLVDMASVRGWDEASQIIHLCGFIQELVEDEATDILSAWLSYLNDAAEDEDKGALDAEQAAQALEEEST